MTEKQGRVVFNLFSDEIKAGDNGSRAEKEEKEKEKNTGIYLGSVGVLGLRFPAVH